MSAGFHIDIQDGATPVMEAATAALADRSTLHEFIAGEVENTVRDYLRAIGLSRHATADRLGATPTGHLERAAESVASTSDSAGAAVTITSPGMGRAFRDVTITPTNGRKYLTIPATAEAYGRRARSFNDLRLVFFKGGLLALVKAEQSGMQDRKRSGYETERAASKEKRGTVYFWLVKQVTQKQDRTLLPSDETLGNAAALGTMDYLTALSRAMAAA